MSQLHFYVPDEIETQIKNKAKQANLPLSKYLAQIIKRDVLAQNQWPTNYFELFDAWEGKPQAELDDLPLETRHQF